MANKKYDIFISYRKKDTGDNVGDFFIGKYEVSITKEIETNINKP